MEYCCRIIFFVLLSGATLYPSTQSDLSLGSNLKRVKRMNMPCTVHEDCDSGYYCFDSSLCTKCTDCRLYHREPGEQSCSQHPQHCGPCITGYEPVIFTNNRKRDACKKSVTTSTPPPLSDNSLYYIISSVMGVFIVAMTAICCFKKLMFQCNVEYIKKKIKKDQLEESNDDYCQIPSNTKNAELITERKNQSEESNNECQIPSNPKEFIFKEEEQNVQAGVFRRPYYDHHLPQTNFNQQNLAHEPSTVHISSAPPPYSPRSSPEPSINRVSASPRNLESTAPRDTDNRNHLPSVNVDQNNLRVPSRKSPSLDAHARFWQNLPNFQIINKVLVSNVNDNYSKNIQYQNNEINSGSIEGNKKPLMYKLTQKNDE